MATMYGKKKRLNLNEKFQTPQGEITFLKYIETKENQPLVQYINHRTGEINTDYYGVMYYKVIHYHKRNNLEVPQTYNYTYPIEFKRDLKFGVEIEITIPIRVDLQEELQKVGVKAVYPNSTHDVVTGAWKLVHDGSIRSTSNYKGVEIVSPPSTNFDELEKVCSVLKKVKAKSNKSCGLHVHHDIHELKRQQILRIYNFYSKYEKLIDLMHPESRENNRYCQPIKNIINKVNGCETKTELLKKVAGQGSSSYYNSCRYYKLNLRSFLYYGTIEFRQAASTINFDEISSWITFTHKIIDRALEVGHNIEPMENEDLEKYNENPATGFENMMDELNIYWLTNTSQNLQKRIAKNEGRR